MLANHLHIFPAQGLQPETRISFKDEYCGWIGFGDKVFYFQFRGQHVNFYLKLWNEEKAETTLIKQLDSAIFPTIRSLLFQARLEFFKANIDIEKRMILGRQYILDGDNIQLFSLKKGDFIPLKQSSLFAEVILQAHFKLTQAQIDEAMNSLFYAG